MIRFVDALGMTLPKPRMRDLCIAVELSDDESKYFLLRCSDRLTADQIEGLHGITTRQQRIMLPMINNKIQIWIDQHPEFFTGKELIIINRVLTKHNLPPTDYIPQT